MERKRLNRLKVVLAEKNMTNKRLAELVGKDPAMVSKWVTNVAQPNWSAPQKLDTTQKRSVYELFSFIYREVRGSKRN